MGIPQFDLLPVPCQTSLVKGQSKGKSCNHAVMLYVICNM